MTTAIVDHLWQSTLCAIVAWLLTLALRNNAASVRYWVWLAASIKFLIPFSMLAILGGQFSWQGALPEIPSNVFFTAVQQFAEPLATPDIVLRSPQAQAFDVLPIVFATWMLGCLLLLARWGVSWFRIVAAVRKSVPLAIQAPIAVKSTPVMSEPGVVGVVRPILLLPEGIAARLSAAQLQAILAHELCHVRRRDNLTAAIHMLVEVLFWFHPLVWWIGARLVEERERACDENVVAFGNQPQAYAEGILKVCQFYLESKLTCVAGVSGANLKKRVEVIMSNRSVDNLNVGKKILLATVASLTVAMPLGLGLIASPQVSAQVVVASDMRRAFDEVSITAISVPAQGAKPNGWSVMKDGHYAAKNQPLRSLLAFAYGVEKSRVIGGPDWIDSPAYDIDAKAIGLVDRAMPENLDQYRPMMKAMLSDRFGLIMHKETQTVSVFVMTIADQGALFTKSPPPTGLPAWVKAEPRAVADKGGILFQEADMQMLGWTLASALGRPVLDQTKITGRYTYRLDAPYVPGVARWETLPALVEKQLGLKLEPQMVPLDVVVIDSILHPRVDPANAATANSTATPAAASPTVKREKLLKQRSNAATLQALVTGTQPTKQTSNASSLIVPAVGSVRLTPGATRTAMVGGQIVQHDEDAFTATNTTLKELITTAYGGAPGRIVGGPPWMETARFDVTLKLVPPNQLADIPEQSRGTRIESYRGMQVQLRQLLAERFNLIVRRDSNVVVTLLAATDGAKLQRSNANALDWRGVRDGGESIVGQGASVQDLIAVLSARLSRPVLNRTALNETYDFQFQLPAGESLRDSQKISAALSEQLGLSLGSIAIPTLVIERATKPGDVI